ncbi:MAG: hypothetical protein ACREBV_02240, partial [Candidatus Zixiibacteriota bacterium]
KLAVYNLIKEKRKQAPLLLFDEIFAELDNRRSNAIIESFGDFQQLFLTTAAESPKRLLENAKSFKIGSGRLDTIG